MTIKDYAEVLKCAIKLQIDYINEDLENAITINDETHLEGMIQGLEIALQKIDASMFLAEK